MSEKYSKCKSCPAYHLLTEDRRKQIDYWEYKRTVYLTKIKEVKLILLGESMPSRRYFYDLNTDYNRDGLRYTLKREFNKQMITDSEFLLYLSRKGIILLDCALCPVHKIKDSRLKKKAATYCFLSITNEHFAKFSSNIPIVTIFPSSGGYLKSYIPLEFKARVIKDYGFKDQTGLRELYESLTK